MVERDSVVQQCYPKHQYERPWANSHQTGPIHYGDLAPRVTDTLRVCSTLVEFLEDHADSKSKACRRQGYE
jgi:hypothetical protein